MPHPQYVKFPVIETMDLSGPSTIREAVDRMVEAYLAQGPLGNFSYRILLPRDQKSTRKAKMIGHAFKESLYLDCADETSCQMCAKYDISTMRTIMDGCLQTLKCISSLKGESSNTILLLHLKVLAQYVV